MTIALIAEKPSQAKNFAEALGGMKGTYQGDDYVIVSLRGHLYELADPSVMVGADLSLKYKSWELENLPWNPDDLNWKRKPREGATALLKELKVALNAVDDICIGVDHDPSGEGDLLAWMVLDELKLHHKNFTRMEFTDEAPASIQKAFAARRPIKSMMSEPAYLMADFRNRFDFLSMQFTRVATKCAGQRAVLRQGRLKSAMLVLVGDQLKAYNDYKKVPFFENRFKDENGVVYSNPDEPNFPAKTDVPNSYATSPVILDRKNEKRQAPPKLLDLAGLSSILAAKGLKAAMVLKTYQALYEAKVVSYPRTEDKTVTTEQFNELLPLIDQIGAVVGADTSLLTRRTPRKTHVKDSGAHGANRPGPVVPVSLDALKAKYGPAAPHIYETLAKNYLAMLAEDYVYERQEGHLEKYPVFKGAVNVPKSLGYKGVFNAGDDDDDDENAAGLGTNADPFVHEGVNKRPEHPSMKWLMKQLEKRDVGTGATRTSTFADVTNERTKFPLLSETRGKITMSEFGDMGYLMLPGTRIGDLGTTEFVQNEMKAVAAGTKTADEALKIVAEWVREDIVTMQNNAVIMRKELNVAEIKEKEKFEGAWAKTGEVVSFNRTWGSNDHWDGHRFNDEECQKLLSGAVVSFDAVAKSGNPYTAVGTLETGVFKEREFVGFKLDFDKHDPTASPVPKIFLGHTFTDDERTKLEAGEKVLVQGLKSKKGNTFAATISVGIKDGETRESLILEFN